MEYTFLPYTEQRKMRREYRVRVWIVSLFFISVSCVIGVGSLFPAYIYASFEERTHLNQVANFKKTTDVSSVAATQKELSASAALLSTLSDSLQPDVYSSAIRSITTLRGNVVLDSFTVDHPSSSTMAIVVSGVAPRRDDLLAFKSRLEGLSEKTTVDLPIAALARDADISFSLQINETLP